MPARPDRRARRAAAGAALLALAGPAPAAPPAPDPLTARIPASREAQWLAPQAPLRLYGDTYYVGTHGLSSVLIDTGSGLILVDTALPQSVPTLEDHVRSLGFRLKDVRYILVTEPHFDHAGGAAALARDTGATVVAGPAAARVLRTGRAGPDDPQEPQLPAFPAVADVRELRDGEQVVLGHATVTAIATPGHTAGSTSWTWRTCEGPRCVTAVFGASLNPVSADGFRFSDTPLPGVFRASIARVGALPCDLLVSAHPDNSDADRKLAELEAGGAPNPFLVPGACRAYAERAAGLLDQRLASDAVPR
jgi:metallo-beta-lactamase class B